MKKTLSLTRTLQVFLLCGGVCAAASNASTAPLPDMCFKSSHGIKTYIEGLTSIAESRFNAQAITREQYKKTINEMKGIQKRFSLEKCMASQGKELAVFQCLADNSGNYPFCLNQTP